MKLLIADDHTLVRDTLRAYLESVSEFQVLTTKDLATARQSAMDDGPFDLLMLDLRMPGMNGLDGLKDAVGWLNVAHVALFTGEPCKDIVNRAIDLGAAGVIPKTLPVQSLLNVIRFMAMGEVYVPLGIMREPDDAGVGVRTSGFTQREHQILTSIGEGLTNKEIAQILKISEHTVKLSAKTLFRKLGVTNRTQAALTAKDHGLLDPIENATYPKGQPCKLMG